MVSNKKLRWSRKYYAAQNKQNGIHVPFTVPGWKLRIFFKKRERDRWVRDDPMPDGKETRIIVFYPTVRLIENSKKGPWII